MTNYEYSDTSIISVNKVREALECQSTAFSKNSQACAVEAFEEILKNFHTLSPSCKTMCYAHSVFGYEFCEEISCKCARAYGDKLSDYLIRAYVTELYQMSQNTKNQSLDELLGRSLASQSHVWPCTNCGKVKYTMKKLIKKPPVFSISFSWAEMSPRLINWFAGVISPVILLRNLFSLDPEQSDYPTRYIIKGLICFTSSHYVAFFYSLRRNIWIEFDDERVIQIEHWNEVLGKIMRGRMAPVLMFYEMDAVLDELKIKYQLELLNADIANYLLDPDIYFESYTDVLSLDLAGMEWKIEFSDDRRSKNKK